MTIKDLIDVYAAFEADSGILSRLTESVEKGVLELLEDVNSSDGNADSGSVAACLHLEPMRLTADVCSTLASFVRVVSGVHSYGDDGNEKVLLGTKASLLRLSLNAYSPFTTFNHVYVLSRAAPDWPRAKLGTDGEMEVMKNIPRLANFFEKLTSERTADRAFANEQRQESSDMLRWSVLTDVLMVHRRMLSMVSSVLDLQQQLCLSPAPSHGKRATDGQSVSVPEEAFTTVAFQLASASFALHRFASNEIFGPYP